MPSIVSKCPRPEKISTVQYSPVQFSTAQYSSVHPSTVQYSSVQSHPTHPLIAFNPVYIQGGFIEDAVCAIFLKSGRFEDIKYDTERYVWDINWGMSGASCLGGGMFGQ